MSEFKIVADYHMTGDQPGAVQTLTQGIFDGKRHQTLMGVTGSGKTFTMIQMETDVQTCVQHSSFDQFHQISRSCVLSGTGGNLENQGCIFDFCRIHDSLNDFHVVHIESADRIVSCQCLFKHCFACNESHFSLLLFAKC